MGAGVPERGAQTTGGRGSSGAVAGGMSRSGEAGEGRVRRRASWPELLPWPRPAEGGRDASVWLLLSLSSRSLGGLFCLPVPAGRIPSGLGLFCFRNGRLNIGRR
jgi:hypothetical protein